MKQHNDTFQHIVSILLLIAFVAIGCGTNVQPIDTTNNPTSQTVSQEAQDNNATTKNAGAAPLQLALQSKLVDLADRTPLAKGAVVPDFTFTFTDGTTHQLSDFRGKKVLVNFWATWCPPCNAEMPDIQRAATQYASDGMVVLAVSQDKDASLIESFGIKYQLTFPLIADATGAIAARYGTRGLPTTYFVNSDGTLFAARSGMVDLAYIKQNLAKMQ